MIDVLEGKKANPEVRINGGSVYGGGEEFIPGKRCVLGSVAHCTDFAVIFEDDGETAYFYGVNVKEPDLIEEALHIYDVESIADRDIASMARIIWSPDGLKSMLFLNDYPHAVFDFEAKRAYCRNNYPAPKNWTEHDFAWDDGVMGLFFDLQ